MGYIEWLMFWAAFAAFIIQTVRIALIKIKLKDLTDDVEEVAYKDDTKQ